MTRTAVAILCARGHAGLNHLYHPERLLYPSETSWQTWRGKMEAD